MVFGKNVEMQPRPLAIKFEPRSAKLKCRWKAVVCECLQCHESSHYYHHYSEEGERQGLVCVVTFYLSCGLPCFIFHISVLHFICKYFVMYIDV